MNNINRNYCKGQIIVLFAISLIVLVGIVGLAIDSGRAYGVKAKLSASVDAAAIAAARGLAVGANDSDRIENAKDAALKFYDGNFP
ncbi:MAG: pilus assembly protein TadG-related protein, partial [Methylobacter sp.]|nr:pilus assembly protein TadG-related protein [Methylobacter sp.]